ncbi:MAG: hypothetical protein KGZ58_04955 [Ignavibacteriales bacterium]|nr:hypothetical protein [Ignavibacteriales bacterium]
MKSLRYSFKMITKKTTAKPKLRLSSNLVEEILLHTSPPASADLVQHFVQKLHSDGKLPVKQPATVVSKNLKSASPRSRK